MTGSSLCFDNIDVLTALGAGLTADETTRLADRVRELSRIAAS